MLTIDLDLSPLVEATLTRGGTTTALDGTCPTTGYAVALPGAEVIVPLADLPTALPAYVSHYREALSAPDRYLGTWVDDGQVYLDISTVYPERVAAIAAGHTAKQLAIFDLSTLTTITL